MFEGQQHLLLSASDMFTTNTVLFSFTWHYRQQQVCFLIKRRLFEGGVYLRVVFAFIPPNDVFIRGGGGVCSGRHLNEEIL